MDSRDKIITIDGAQVRITHPDKELIKMRHLCKVDLIDYYLKVRVPLLEYGLGRPLSEVRYPRGYPGISFFQRNKPKGAPKWVQSISLGIYKKADYVILKDMATIIWLLNLGSLEFHTAQVRLSNLEQPDVMVFDIDPPDGSDFEVVRDFAISIKPIIESYGYTCYVKTSGKTGLHIFCPIVASASFDQVFEAAKEIGADIVSNFTESTLSIRKKDRVQKILVDIYRNHSYQSMALPYGIRATPDATVSMPLSWKVLESISSPTDFNVYSVPEYIEKYKDPWEDMGINAIALHNKNEKILV